MQQQEQMRQHAQPCTTRVVHRGVYARKVLMRATLWDHQLYANTLDAARWDW